MHRTRLFAAILLVLVGASAAATEFPPADTVSGVSDPGLLSRYAGSRLVGFAAKSFDETVLAAGKYKRIEAAPGLNYEKVLRVEGRITRIMYNYPKERSSLEVMRNYAAAIQGAGMTIVFRCDRESCGEGFGDEFEAAKVDDKVISYSQDQYNVTGPFNYGRLEPRYVLASLARSDGAKTYAAVLVVPPAQDENGGVYVEIVEPVAMETGKVSADPGAEQMARSIATDGRIALYGLYFDTDQVELRPESGTTLGEMAKVLRQDPRLSAYIVGHTDNQGTLAHNLDLSQRRAEAVTRALVTRFQIAASRLQARGVASFAPVSTNDTEAGRARNRRVEMVKQ